MSSEPEVFKELVPPPGVDDPDGALQDLVSWASPLLKPLGFKKRGTQYYRDSGLSVQWLWFMKSRWRVGKDWPLVFYVRTMLEVRPFGSKPATTKPRSSDIDFEVDLTCLLGEDQFSAEIANRADAEAVWPEVRRQLREAFITFAGWAITVEGLRQIETLDRCFIDWRVVFGDDYVPPKGLYWPKPALPRSPS